MHRLTSVLIRTVLALGSVLILGIGAELTGAQISLAQQRSDSRVADLVQAGKLRVGLGLGSPALAVKDAATGEVRGPALELARALAERIGVKLEPVYYPRPGAVLEGLRTNAWDVTFLVAEPARAGEVDFPRPTCRVTSPTLFLGARRFGASRMWIALAFA